MLDEKRLFEIPKVELHCHLDGSLTVSLLSELLGRRVRLEELQVAKDCRDLAQYLEKFQLPLQCLTTEQGLKKAGKDFLLSASKEHMDYIEVRFAPLLHTHQDLSIDRVIEAVLDGIKEGEKLCNTKAQVIVCAMRHHNPNDSLSMFRVARSYLNDGVCAGDLAGNEAAFPMELFHDLFSRVHDMEIPFTIHAGECGRAKNIEESILVGAKRIGHGIAMKGNKEVQELCKKHRIGIEMCPISNMQTKAVENEADYPLGEFLKNQLLVTINTDNRTVSNTTMTKELMYIINRFGVEEDQIYQILQNGIEASFAKDETKAKLLKHLEESWNGR